MKFKFTLWGIFCFFLLCSITSFANTLSILTQQKKINYFVEIADTPRLQRKGLMYRQSMPKDHGMLFIFDEKKPISMWMKNTYIPLDMLFVDEKGIIQHIHENAHPLDETIITCPIPVKYVIELNAGQIKTNDIHLGDTINF